MIFLAALQFICNYRRMLGLKIFCREGDVGLIIAIYFLVDKRGNLEDIGEG